MAGRTEINPDLNILVLNNSANTGKGGVFTGQIRKFLKNGNWYIDYYVNGRRRRERIGPSKKLAERVLGKRKAQVAENKFLDVRKEVRLKFEVFADEFLELHCKLNNRSWASYATGNLKVLKKHFSGQFLSEITALKVEQFKSDRSKEVTPATVNRSLTVLKSLFNRAIDWGRFRGENPVRKVKFFKENNERLRYLEKDEIVRLLAACHKHLKPIVVVALNTGMRRGEILTLQWSDCDFKRDIIYLKNTKNGEPREVPMNTQVKAALVAVKKHPRSDYIFYNKDGSRIQAVKRSFFTALTKSDINNFRFHDLRHTFASHLVMSGVDLNTVRELLGHKSIAMTLRYSHLSPDHKKRAVDVLSERMTVVEKVDNVPVAQLDRASALKLQGAFIGN